jgi:hypothetical protein
MSVTMRLRIAVLVIAATLTARTLLTAADVAPDIIGIRPGMPVQDALKLLRAHDPNAYLTIGQATIPELGPKPAPSLLHLAIEDYDIIAVHIALPPNEQVVWGVARRLRFPRGKGLLRDAVVATLREKYGGRCTR